MKFRYFYASTSQLISNQTLFFIFLNYLFLIAFLAHYYFYIHWLTESIRERKKTKKPNAESYAPSLSPNKELFLNKQPKIFTLKISVFSLQVVDNLEILVVNGGGVKGNEWF